MNATIEHYREQFQQAGQAALLLEPARRQAAWEAFASAGFPDTKSEAWRYTRLTALEKLSLSCVAAEQNKLSWNQLQSHCLLPNAPRLVLVDGILSPALSSLQALPAGIQLEPVSRQGLGAEQSFDWKGNVLSGFTAAFAREGFCLRVEAGVRVDAPLLVMHVSLNGNQVASTLNRIEMGATSQALLLEQFVALTDEPCWNNQWIEARLEAESELTHVRWLQGAAQSWQWSRQQIEQHQGSQYHSHQFAVSGRLGRQEIEVNLSQPGASAHLAGAWWARGQEHQDVHTLVRHQAGSCESSQTFKGVLDDRARAVFDGRILVAEQAQKTSARQANHNLLLSRDAEVDTKPQLEILADDVKCSHGTTVGQINEEQLFYLLSRGVGADDARAMLIEAFVQEVAEGIAHPQLRQVVGQRLHEVLHG